MRDDTVTWLDPKKWERFMKALLQMDKLDIKTLKQP
jgi:hypothetical protein